MERPIKAFYPSGTEKIIHRGKTGNTYLLDAIDQPVRIRQSLEQDPKFKVVDVEGVDDSILYLAHQKELIDAYKTGKPIELSQSSGLLWQPDFYPWVVNKAWATIRVVDEAIKNSKAIAITSGGHHAEYEHGRGFGPISNMVISAKHLLNKGVIGRVAILDLDVHYANGTHSQVVGENRILSCDIWKYSLPYWKQTPNGNNVVHTKVDNVDQYFQSFDLMCKRIKAFSPDILFVYNGLDPLQNDRMGGVEGFDEKVLFKRNRGVFKFLEENKLSACVFIGGGYIDYSKPAQEIENSKKHLTDLFVRSTSAIFGLV